jgi:hypothetical protein
MKCKDCQSCRKGYFKSLPNSYVCIGIKEPFIISDINAECTEYPEKNNKSYTMSAKIAPTSPLQAYVGDDGIYIPSSFDSRYYNMLISKELFVEAYNKWIKDGAAE